MNWGKLLGYGAAALIGLFVLRIVVGVVFGVVGFLLSLLWTLITVGVTIAVAAGLVYGAYLLYDVATEDSSSISSTDSLGERTTNTSRDRELERELE